MTWRLTCTFCFILCLANQAHAWQQYAESTQSEELSESVEAGKQLRRTLQCLRGKAYPEDMEICGVQGFGTLHEIDTFESCLASQAPAKLFSLAQQSCRKENEKMASSIECDQKTVLVVFRRQGKGFIVDGINYLME